MESPSLPPLPNLRHAIPARGILLRQHILHGDGFSYNLTARPVFFPDDLVEFFLQVAGQGGEGFNGVHGKVSFQSWVSKSRSIPVVNEGILSPTNHLNPKGRLRS